MTVIVIFLTFTASWACYWISAQDVRAGVMTPAGLVAIRDRHRDGGEGRSVLCRKSGASCSGRRTTRAASVEIAEHRGYGAGRGAAEAAAVSGAGEIVFDDDLPLSTARPENFRR